MRHIFRRNFAVISLVLSGVLCGVSSAQPNKVNPFTGIAWPANCSASGTVAYNFLDNTCFAAGSSTAPIVYRGAWSSVTTYALNNAVLFSGNQYVSLQNANLNQNPGTATSFWALLLSSDVTAATMQAALATQTGCTTTGFAWNPATNTCVASTVTAAAMQSALAAQAGCTTAGLAWNPATNTCVAATSASTPVSCTANAPGIICAALAPYYVSGSGALATTTSGTTTPGTSVTLAASGCTNAGFSSATAGAQYGHQGVSIAGAGAAGAIYTGTVTTCVGTAMVVTPATSTSVAGGAAVSHDESAAINAMFTATAAGRNDIYFPCGTVLASGPLKDTGGANAVLQVPTIVADTTPVTVIGMHGCAPFDSPATLTATNTTTIQTAVNTGNLIGGYDATPATYAPITNVFLTVDNFIIQLPASPGIVAVNARTMNQLQANHVWCNGGGTSTPSGGGCFFYPTLSSGPGELGLDLIATNVFTGFLIGEHAQMFQLQVSGVVNGYELDTGTNTTIPSNESNTVNITKAWCGSSTNCVTTGSIGATITIQDLEVESTTNILNDSSNRLHGPIWYKVNPIATSSVVGGANVTLYDLLNGTCAGPLCGSTATQPFSGLLENWLGQDGQGTKQVNSGVDFSNVVTGTNVTWATATGFTGKVATYNGTTSFATANSTTNMNFDGSLPFSVCAWWNWTNTSDAGPMVVDNLDNNAPAIPGFGFDLFGSTTPIHAMNVYLSHDISTNVIQIESPPGSIPTTGVNLGCFTYDGSKTAAGTTIYIDGVAQASTVVSDTLTGSIVSSAPLMIGALSTSSGGPTIEFFAGAIGRVRIYNRKLSATEIATMYSGGPSAF